MMLYLSEEIDTGELGSIVGLRWELWAAKTVSRIKCTIRLPMMSASKMRTCYLKRLILSLAMMSLKLDSTSLTSKNGSSWCFLRKNKFSLKTLLPWRLISRNSDRIRGLLLALGSLPLTESYSETFSFIEPTSPIRPRKPSFWLPKT